MYLLDTNHCSQIINNHSAVIKKLTELNDVPVATCVIVRGELLFGAYKSERYSENLSNIKSFLKDIDIIPVDDRVADVYGELKAAIIKHFGPKEKAKQRRFTIDDLGIKENDLWIAAVAKSKDYTIVSTDSDFDRIKQAVDIKIESWLAEKTSLPTDNTSDTHE